MGKRTTTDVLTAVLDRIRDPERWVARNEGAAAVDADGRWCDPRDDAAVRWSVWGAIGRETDVDSYATRAALRRLYFALPIGYEPSLWGLQAYHDTCASHDGVLHMIKTAIEMSADEIRERVDNDAERLIGMREDVW